MWESSSGESATTLAVGITTIRACEAPPSSMNSSKTCSGSLPPPQITSEPVRFDSLITQTYEATPADMGITSADSTQRTHFITCGKGDIGPSYERGSWIAEIGSDTIAMNWFDSVLLFLQRTR